MEKYRVYAGIDLDAVRYNMQRQLKICHTYGDMLLLLQKKQKNYGSMDAKSLC